MKGATKKKLDGDGTVQQGEMLLKVAKRGNAWIIVVKPRRASLLSQ